MITLLTNIYYPNLTSTGYYMTRIVDSINSLDNVQVITSKQTKQNKKNDRIEEIHTIGNLNIRNKNLVIRVLDFFYFTISTLIITIRLVKPNSKVLMVTNPPTLILINPLIKKVLKTKSILFLHDFFPFNYFLINNNFFLKPFKKIIIAIFGYSYKSFDKVIVIGDDMKEFYIKNFGSNQEIKVIPNWSEVSEFKNIKKPQNKMPVIQFAGNIGIYQTLDKFIEIYIKSNQIFEIDILGDGINISKCSKLKKLNNLKFLNLRGRFPREEQEKFLSYSDIGLITLKEGMFGLGVPSKFYNLLAAGKPILFIGDKNSEIYKQINKHEIGWVFSWDEEEEIIKFLNKLPDKELIEKLGIRSREISENFFSENEILSQIKNEIIEI